MNKNYWPLFIIFLFLIFLCGNLILEQKQVQKITEEEFLMNTFVSISTYGTNTDFLQEASHKAFLEMRRIAALTDRFPLPETREANASDVFRLNEMAGIKPVIINPDVLAMIMEAQKFSDLSNGTFDITIGPLADLWGFGREIQKEPTAEELSKTLALVDYQKMIVNQAERSIFLSKAGMSVDLGAVAKGYAVEKAAGILVAAGIKGALINAGGNIKVIGEKTNKQPWQIGIQDPTDPSAIIGILTLENEAIATSGGYHRTIESKGKRYHHLLSPQTGYPVEHNLSVTVITPDAGKADILSTVLFLLEPLKALTFIEQLENTEVVIISATKEIFYSPGLQGKFKLQAPEGYHYD